MLREAFSVGARLEQKRRWLLATGAVLVSFVLYCSGHQHGERTAGIAQMRAGREAAIDTVRVVEQRLRVDTVRVRETSRMRGGSATHSIQLHMR